jgi:hypothetical protein
MQGRSSWISDMVWIISCGADKVNHPRPSPGQRSKGSQPITNRCHGGRHGHLCSAAQHFARGDGDDGADALAAGHERISHRLVHRRRLAIILPLARQHIHALGQLHIRAHARWGTSGRGSRGRDHSPCHDNDASAYAWHLPEWPSSCGEGARGRRGEWDGKEGTGGLGAGAKRRMRTGEGGEKRRVGKERGRRGGRGYCICNLNLKQHAAQRF